MPSSGAEEEKEMSTLTIKDLHASVETAGGPEEILSEREPDQSLH